MQTPNVKAVKLSTHLDNEEYFNYQCSDPEAVRIFDETLEENLKLKKRG